VVSQPNAGSWCAPVRSRRDLGRFLRLPWRIYDGNPHWVAPLLVERRAFLDRRKNAFFGHSDAELFLAERGGEVVGPDRGDREPAPPRDLRDGTGFFGSSSASTTVKSHRRSSRAPPTGCGAGASAVCAGDELHHQRRVRPAGRRLRPAAVLLMSYNPPTTGKLLEGAGFVKSQDLFAYRMDVPERVPERLAAAAAAVAARAIVVRKLDFRALRRGGPRRSIGSTRRPGRRTGARCRSPSPRCARWPLSSSP